MESKLLGHPCFNKDVIYKIGRIHLPVAKSCNIKCNYCDRNISCINDHHPGACSKVLSPQEALRRYKDITSRDRTIKIVGISGPGDPLFNQETFETFELIRNYDAQAEFCISTNGLLLEDLAEVLLNYNVKYVTVTVNAVDSNIAQNIYEFAMYNELLYFGKEAAELIVHKQQYGIYRASELGLMVKVNTVLIPGINNHHIEEVAARVKALGAKVMNIMPLIPYAKFSDIERPSCSVLAQAREKCSKIIQLITHCRQCRSDEAGLLV
ncbi:Radical SAM domain protein [Caldicellulosiruptor acetigenus I77R1B]|uniref:FeMo cofactor biosynthesis protein NifB n=2 Tax=Caldicellulosiruptor TaxID=44000 RepID=E4SAV8_CALA7|nr:radical SAM protein [Caldicellulosiruptor acetigenus]ADQ41279.1 Radical SAM domain protein [Caldicellulosiruptor acetigenus I77R1B]WAM35805.1 radical SAM protein [Caldicellulosiruptor acetigenus]